MDFIKPDYNTLKAELFNKDSLEVLKSFGDKTVDAVITDPPYDFDEKTKRTFHEQFIRISKGAIIVFSPPENQWMPTADQYLFWVKPISTKNTSKTYSRFVEMIQVWNGTTWNNDRHWSQYTNVFTDLVDDHEHPYAKPLSLMTRLIKNHTNKGDSVLEPFMGSGTTVVACLQNGRLCKGIELDTERYNVAVDRIATCIDN